MIARTEDADTGRNDFTDSVKAYYQELRRYDPIPREKERELMRKAKAGDIDARNEIVSSNLRFVFEIAKKYRGHGVDIADLISEGNKAMMKAIDRFDMSKDVKFYTYAVWWVRQHMMQLIDERNSAASNEVSFEEEFPCDDRGICNLGEHDEDSDFYYEGNDITDGDPSESFENEAEEDQKHFVVQKLLAKLDSRERVIIMKYFGIENDDEGHNLEEISNEVHLSTERVRQLKVKAINTMRAEVFNMEEANFLFR